MLDDTLVIWGGEFGRTPFGQGDPANPKGRDHFGKAYSWWLAGGGVKPGTVYGATDDFAWNITSDPVHVHDMQATILHLCGIDHTRLTFRYQGRQYRLTDVHGNVVKGIMSVGNGYENGYEFCSVEFKSRVCHTRRRRIL